MTRPGDAGDGAAVRLARCYDTQTAPADMQAAATLYADRFGTAFAQLIDFDRELLEDLRAQHGHQDLPPGVRVASAADPTVVDDVAQLSATANLPQPTIADRHAYFSALLRIYRKLPVSAADLASRDVMCVGPEREGRQLATALGALPPARSITPSAKRISYRGGIVVGMSALPATTYRRFLVVDGVVASGATVMALLHTLPRTTEQVTLLTAHSTAAGAWAIHRYAARLGIGCQLVVGHVCGKLSEKFYAVDEHDPNRLVLGDVGDTISGLPAPDVTPGPPAARQAR